MGFSVTYDNVYFLYPYYSLDVKMDEKSKEVYQVFKRGWNVDTFFPGIHEDLFEAFREFFAGKDMTRMQIAITVMPSHSKGKHNEYLLKMASMLAKEFGFVDASTLIQRKVEKTKSTEGGERTVNAHLMTMGLANGVKFSTNSWYIILDDITTTGSSLEAAKKLLTLNGVNAGHIIKVAIAKTMHDM